MLAILAESALRSLMLGSAVWVGLNLLRVRNPHVHMTSWAMVLLASLAMPLLMHWTTVTVTLDALPMPAPEALWPAGGAPNGALPAPLPPSLPPETGSSGISDISAAAVGVHHASVDWGAIATAIYAFVAGTLLLRLVVGLRLTWRLARAAKPVREWATAADVRISDRVAGPVTFASTILLPPQCTGWDVQKRQAVLAHEGAHVANRDFYILLLASLNRAVFWFSPFAWWQLTRLAELAETISDARALEVIEDRLSYAEILLDLVQGGRRMPAPAGLEMARACTVRARIERILSLTTVPARVGWRKRIWTAAALLPVVAVCAGSIDTTPAPASAPVAEAATAATTVLLKPQRVDFYSLGSSIFMISQEGDALFGQSTGQRKLRLSAADGSYVYPFATGQISFALVNALGDEKRPSELALRRDGRDLRAPRLAGLRGEIVKADAASLESYVGRYELTPSRLISVTRVGDRLRVQESGRLAFDVAAHGGDAFSSNRNDIVVFLRDVQTGIDRVLFQDPVSGARLAGRVDAARAKIIEAAFAKQMVEAPDRFRDQVPLPGSKEAVLRGIEDVRHGAPNYDRMSPALAAAVRRQALQLQSTFMALGDVESIYFRGVGPGGYDIYGLKFAKGFAEFRILLTADGKAEDVIFRPDGNDAPGGVLACSQEQGLKSRDDTAPIKLLFYNESGKDLQLYRLDSQGRRIRHSTIGDDTSAPVWTNVDSPWVLADASGQCLEIVLPGQRTRYHTVELPRTGVQPERPASPRTTPLGGSEDMLRQYIEALGRGEPNYDRMTSEVAAQTRRQLVLDQAILARLGALRAVSFRGVTQLGSDVYVVHFANGSAEWRIGLVKDGTIGRIALGPQY